MQALSWRNLRHFVSTLSGPLRRRERGPGAVRRRDFDSEHLACIGALVAGAAHDLCSPLTTMAVLVDELRRHPGNRTELAENLRIMSDQLEICRHILSRLVAQGSAEAAPSGGEAHVEALLSFAADEST